MTTFFKYRPLGGKKNNSRMKDIINNQQLYCSLYTELNDPLELFFSSNKPLRKDEINDLEGGKRHRYLCSFSSSKTGYHNNIMWAMYANNHNGCCIEFEIDNKDITPKGVKYHDDIPMNNNPDENFINQEMFYRKTIPWKHENEWRVCLQNAARPTLKIRIKNIYIGVKVSKNSLQYWKRYIQDTLGNKVSVFVLKPENLDYGNGKYKKVSKL